MCIYFTRTGSTSDTPIASPEVQEMPWGGERGEKNRYRRDPQHGSEEGLAVEYSGTGTTHHTDGRGLAGEYSGIGTTPHTRPGGAWQRNAAVPARLYTPVSPPPPETNADAEGRRKFAQCAASRQYKQ
jgi:hypothetical protein